MLNKRESQEIILEAISNCRGKTISQMQELIKDDNQNLYNSVVHQLIDTRKTELAYTDGTGAVYL